MKADLLYIGNQLSTRGGSPTSVDTLAPLLQQEGYEVITASGRKNKILRLTDMLITVVKNYQSIDYVLIDTYSTANFWYAHAVAVLCRRLRVEYIPVLHGGELPKRLKKSPGASSAIFRHSYINISPSLYLKAAFQKASFANVTYIPNSIDLINYSFKERKKIKPKLLWVRAFDEIYNPILALKVLDLLLMNYPESELCMVGPEKDESLENCRRYTLQKKLPVKFPGKISKEDWRILSLEYDIFLNTTNVDNTPVSIIEAMALGLPVVSTNVGGLPFLISADIDGLLVPPDNPERMAAAIEKLLKDSDRAVEISRAARKKVAAFDWEVVKHQWEEILRK